MDPETNRGHHPRAVILATFIVAMALSTAGAFLWARFYEPGILQPIAFNHRKHVTESSIECSTCHAFYETEAFSGLPTAEICGMCHSEPLGKSQEEKKLVKMIRENQPLVWRPLFRQPAHVYYSHRRHVVAAKLRCERCHGEIGQADSPPRRVRRLAMEDCIACHTAEKVAVDCTTCHR